MRILLCGINYSPELTGIGKYSGEMAQWLVEQGHEVKVVTAPPYYPAWHVSKGYSGTVYRYEIIDGVGVWRCPLYVPSSPSGLKRILHLLSFAVSSLPVLFGQLFWHPDVIIAIEPPLVCAPAVLIVGMLARAKVLLHIQDFEVDAAFDLGLIKSTFLRRVVGSFERWLMAGFDLISTISDRMMERLTFKGVDPRKVLLFPNWVDTQTIFPSEKHNSMREELGFATGTVVALYSGNMGEKQGLETLVEVARQLQGNSTISFVLCGQGAAYQRLRLLAEGLENIIWLPLQPLEKLNELLNMADIHLLPQRADVADLVMPSKLTGMLASGRPVVATALAGTQVAQVLERAGVVVPPGDVEQFVKALERLAKDSDLRKRMGEDARQFALENLGRDAVLSAFEENLKSLLT